MRTHGVPDGEPMHIAPYACTACTWVVIATHHTCPVRDLSYIACLRNCRETAEKQVGMRTHGVPAGDPMHIAPYARTVCTWLPVYVLV